MTPGAGGFRFSQGPSAILEAEASGKAWVTGVAVMRIFGFVPKAVGPMYTEVSPDRDNARAVEARVVIELINISCILAILPPKRISFPFDKNRALMTHCIDLILLKCFKDWAVTDDLGRR